MKYDIVKAVKFFVDTLLISVVYLIFKTITTNHTNNIVEVINYSSTIFIESIFIAIALLIIIKLILLWRKKF